MVMRAGCRAVCLAALFLVSCPSIGQTTHNENSDLDFIPGVLTTPKPVARTAPKKPAVKPKFSDLTGKAFVEDAVTGWANRSSLDVPVPVQSPSWQNRTSLDLSYSWQLSQRIKLLLSDRLNILEGDTIVVPSSGNVRNDFREGLISAEILDRFYVEAGRINLKNGGALGFNPTDFFKSRTNVDLVSIDPSALKENRLGVVMIEAQKLWTEGSLTMAFAPQIQNESPLLIGTPQSLDPLFGQTNYFDRGLVTLSYEIADFNPQALVFFDENGTHVGANLSRTIGSSVVAFAEWSGAREGNLTQRAIAFGERTATVPQGSPIVPQNDSSISFQNDLALGGSWASSFKFSVNLEYHYHQGGFTGEDFNNWIALGSSNSRLASELWFIRQYAGDQQEPLMQNEVFLRLDYPDAIPSKLNLGLVTFINPYDGSVLAQGSGQYFFSRNWTFGTYLSGSLGAINSEKGSLPWIGNGVLQIIRYL